MNNLFPIVIKACFLSTSSV